MEDQHHFKRSLGLWDATMLVAGSMIGSGIFIVSADMSRYVSSAGWLMFMWILSGAITVMAALCYGELAGMMPKAGGQFVYIQRAFGNFTSFLYGWTVFMVIQTGVIAAVAVAFAKYTAVFFPWFSPDNILLESGKFKLAASQLLAIVLIAFLTFINSRGIKNGKLIQTTFTSAKLLALLFLIVLGIGIGLRGDTLTNNFHNAWDAVQLTQINGAWVAQHISGLALVLALGTAMIGSLFSSDAWNNVTFIAGEIKNPKKNIGLSLFLGTLIVTVIYVLTNVVYLATVPLHDLAFAKDNRVALSASEAIFGSWGTIIIAVMIMISTFGCNNGLILAGARVYYTMAQDKLFFKQAGTLNKNVVPEWALWIQCALACALCLSGKYGDLLDMVSFIVVIFYVLTIAGIFILRKKYPDAERPYKAFGYPVLPIIYILMGISFCTLLIVYKPQFTWPGLIITLIGIPLYYLAVRNKKSTD